MKTRIKHKPPTFRFHGSAVVIHKLGHDAARRHGVHGAGVPVVVVVVVERLRGGLHGHGGQGRRAGRVWE